MTWVGLIVGLFVIIIALLMIGRPQTSHPGGVTLGTLPPVEAIDHVKGIDSAPVTIVEYSDFECPFCAQFGMQISQQLQAEFGDSVRFVYRHFPLTSIHASALPAAQISEAAGLQGKFWEVHDVLFAQQGQWSRVPHNVSAFSRLLEDAGVELNYDQLLDDAKSREVRDRVERNRRVAAGLGLNSTPSVFVNGERVVNATNYAALKGVIEAEIANAQ